MDYLSIGHDYVNGSDNGVCWFFRDKLLVEENTNHSDWLGNNTFSESNFACGRIDHERSLISFVGYELSESRKEFIKKRLEKFCYKIVEC